MGLTDPQKRRPLDQSAQHLSFFSLFLTGPELLRVDRASVTWSERTPVTFGKEGFSTCRR